MDNIKNDCYYIEKALHEISVIQKYSDGKTEDDLNIDSEYTDAVMFRLIQLVENIKNISQDFKDRHPNIKWGNIMGFRNGIVHDYGETDYSIVYQIIINDLPTLKDLFEEEK